jgi:hypothetical protein
MFAITVDNQLNLRDSDGEREGERRTMAGRGKIAEKLFLMLQRI